MFVLVEYSLNGLNAHSHLPQEISVSLFETHTVQVTTFIPSTILLSSNLSKIVPSALASSFDLIIIYRMETLQNLGP